VGAWVLQACLRFEQRAIKKIKTNNKLNQKREENQSPGGNCEQNKLA
jgi:hypothetical protein